MVDWAWGQLALAAWAAACLFAAGARQKGIPFTGRTVWEIAQATLIVVALFALMTEGRGCAHVPTNCLTTGDAGC
jgi:hypothetical protein